MKKRLFTTLIMGILAVASVAQTVVDLEEVYRRVDEEIERWPEYVAVRQNRIDSLTNALTRTMNADEWYACCEELVDEYSCYQNDSAIYYATKLVQTAPWTTDKENVARSKIKMANQAVRSGMYEAALTWLSEIDTTTIVDDTRKEQERVRHFAYVEMAAYCYIWDKRDEYKDKEHECRVVLLKLLPENSAEWLLYKAYDELLADRFDEAEKYNLQCMTKCERYGPLYRDAAFHHRFICEALGREEEASYWLAECTISEIQLAMNDQTGLWSLASKMDEDKLERSYGYIRFAWDAISRYGVNTRKWDISPVLSTIEHKYEAQLSLYNLIITIGALCLMLLAALLALALWVVGRKNRQLAVAHDSLALSNRQLQLSNMYLTDANQVKEKYIVQLLGYNSDFIVQKEEERRTLSKMQRTGKVKELTKMLNAADKTDKELGQLFARFDDIFLEIYPSFIDDFNALLHDDKRIRLTRNERMNTPLRVFALIRLGISNVQDVSRILHCSAQTVYNYRNNYRNAYLGDREHFEEAIREIGMPDLVNK